MKEQSKLDRRGFIGITTSAAAGLALSGDALAFSKSAPRKDFMWGALVHLGSNMWSHEYKTLNVEPKVWYDVIEMMRRNRFNSMVVDVGEALVYPSHPELAVEGSWSPKKLKDELARLRDLGIVPYPKLNFSLTHNLWMKQYRQMVSTPKYYRVVSDLIRDVYDIFEGPELFHIGFDEEYMPGHQTGQRLAIFRQGELWWHDFLKTVEDVERCGARAWTFSDIIWKQPDEFCKKMPKSVIQCPWNFVYNDKKPHYVDSVKKMAALGYDIVPDLCTYTKKPNVIQTSEAENWMKFCLGGGIPEKQLKGFLVCPWRHLVEKDRFYHEKSYDYGGELHARWDKAGGKSNW